MQRTRTIFDFTFDAQLRAKGYRAITIIVALLLLLAPAILVPVLSADSADAADTAPEAFISDVQTIFYASEIKSGVLDLSALQSAKLPGYENAEFIMKPSFDEAKNAAVAGSSSLVLLFSEDENEYSVFAYIPEDSELSESDAEALSYTAQEYFRLASLSGKLSEEEYAAVFTPVVYEILSSEPTDEIRNAFNYILTYLNVMVVYFLVLFYGQDVANCIIMEKSSKLMDTFLVSVKPQSMIAGKMLAVFCAAVMQFLIWVAALIVGFIIGGLISVKLNPTAVGVSDLLGSLGGTESLFAPGGIIVAILMIFAGFLLYCSLAAIGGSVASKPEDLSTSLSAFTLILVASFFCALYSGIMGSGLSAGFTWLDIVPFTAILVTPSRVLLGGVTLGQGLLSLFIVIAVSVLLVLLAGKIYKMMSMYKGKPPKIRQLISMLKT